jgi:hypothetical protein
MREINENNLDTAITLGDAVCEELGICCETRGRIIFRIYKKLEEKNPEKDTADTQQAGEDQAV